MTTIVKADPPVRADGRCAVCLKPRKITAQVRRYAGAQIDLDPFDSTECARKFHGCELAPVGTPAEAEARAESGRQMSERRKAERGWDDEAEVDLVYAELAS